MEASSRFPALPHSCLVQSAPIPSSDPTTTITAQPFNPFQFTLHDFELASEALHVNDEEDEPIPLLPRMRLMEGLAPSHHHQLNPTNSLMAEQKQRQRRRSSHLVAVASETSSSLGSVSDLSEALNAEDSLIEPEISQRLGSNMPEEVVAPAEIIDENLTQPRSQTPSSQPKQNSGMAEAPERRAPLRHLLLHSLASVFQPRRRSGNHNLSQDGSLSQRSPATTPLSASPSIPPAMIRPFHSATMGRRASELRATVHEASLTPTKSPHRHHHLAPLVLGTKRLPHI